MHSSECLIEVVSLTTGYRGRLVLEDVNCSLEERGVVGIIGHNGAGKSTLLKAIFGLIPAWRGTVKFEGSTIADSTPRDLVNRGLVYMPQGGRVFRNMSVLENIEVALIASGRKLDSERLNEVVTVFPRLREKLRLPAGLLSGGERQMLALSRALVLTPRVLLLDEPSLGLSPQSTQDLFLDIKKINSFWGVSFFIVEQNINEVLKASHRTYVLRNGRVAFSGPSTELADKDKLRKVFL